jgi:hypothetical protein
VENPPMLIFLPQDISTHNVTLSVTAMRVHNPDRSPVEIHGMSLIPSALFLIIPKFTEPEKTFLCMDLSRRTPTQNR